jgi:hypothetical protein
MNNMELLGTNFFMAKIFIFTSILVVMRVNWLGVCQNSYVGPRGCRIGKAGIY